MNIQIVKELNKPNKDVTNIIEHLTQMIQLKRKLTKEIKEQKGKMLIENQIQEEFKRKIEEKSNVIQCDQMGYPLRLVIMSSGEQIWIDAHERDGDVVLEWSRQED